MTIAHTLEKITMLRQSNIGRGEFGYGLGFMGIGTAAERLVRFSFNARQMVVVGITLSESAALIRTMQEAEIERDGDCDDRGEKAESRWLELIQAATA